MAEQKEIPYEETDLYRIRHSCAHVMAQAVLEKFPEGKPTIGPPVQGTIEGFYYDFDLPRPLTPEDLDEIERRMKEIIKEKHEFLREEVSPEQAQQIFKDQPYKLELIDDILKQGTDEYGEKLPAGQQPVLSTYQHDSFVDLCRGPHVENTAKIDPSAVKLMHSSSSYWRGDASRPQLQRIYGTAWKNKKQLKDYLNRLEEAKKRDHRVLGRQLDLFSVADDVGPGLILWHPNGAMVRYLSERFSQEAHLLNGYEWVYTPHVGRAKLWDTSGHLENFRENMFREMVIDEEEFFLKPMNCPFHIEIYKNSLRSYRELPKRYAEYGTVYRYELSGVLHGLTRVRGFTQDDAHLFCTPDQVEEEIVKVLRFSMYVLRTFGLTDIKAYISTKPESKAIGSDAEWDHATSALRNAVDGEGLDYSIDEGGGAFYGPKIDLKVNDALGREWQLSTVQFDFNLPERFGLEFIGSDNQPHRPVMVHRALFGSCERFLGLLIEHYGGAFPVWLAPTQVVVVPIADRHVEYAHRVAAQLRDAHIRVQVDDSGERMGNKIRIAQEQKIPFALVVGDSEVEEEKVSVRNNRAPRKEADQGTQPVAQFIASLAEELSQGVPQPVGS